MKKKRLDELEQNIKGIDSEYQPLIELFFKCREAREAGDGQAASDYRKQADKYFRGEQGYTKLAYFPPNDADTSGLIDPLEWLQFVKNF
jgi:hypothetical protein